MESREPAVKPSDPITAAREWFGKQPSGGRIHAHMDIIWLPVDDAIKLLATYAEHRVLAERERCAKIAESIDENARKCSDTAYEQHNDRSSHGWTMAAAAARDVAATIRREEL